MLEVIFENENPLWKDWTFVYIYIQKGNANVPVLLCDADLICFKQCEPV